TEIDVMEVNAKPRTSARIIEIKMAVAKFLFMANSPNDYFLPKENLRDYLGTASSAAAVNTFRPSANVTLPPDALGDPSFARKPSTFTVSPTLRTFRLIPRRANVARQPVEKHHSARLPLTSSAH